MRTCIVNKMSERYGPHWFMDPNHFKAVRTSFKHDQFINNLTKDLKKAKSPRGHSEVFINHYYAKYDDPMLPPAWMIAETLTLGTWSIIFENIEISADRKAIARHLKTDEQILKNWLHVLTYLRNLCAHHSRLWNRLFVIKPRIAKRHESFLQSNERCYAMAVIVEDLLRTIAPGTTWGRRLHHLLMNHPFVNPVAMGFPLDWSDESFWNLLPTP